MEKAKVVVKLEYRGHLMTQDEDGVVRVVEPNGEVLRFLPCGLQLSEKTAGRFLSGRI